MINSSDIARNLQREVVIERTFAAPREVVWRAWTDPAQVAQWWGPAGFTNPVCEIDVRPEGGIRIHMQAPDGAVYPMTGKYREVDPPSRLSFTSAALDDDGQPMFEVLTTITFIEQDGQTQMTLQAKPYNLTPAAAGPLSGMEEGWSQSLVRLTALLAKS